MKLGVMQPYFFPYIGYLQLMSSVDEWVFFDDIQFVNKGWVNRNRILHPNADKEWQYFTIPLRGRGRFDKINQISILESSWKKQLLGKLSFYKRWAPFYKETTDVVGHCIDSESLNLGSFVVSTLLKLSQVFDINVKSYVQSEMDWTFDTIEHSGQWALRIAETLSAKEYVNPVGGASIFDVTEFRDSGIKLTFFEPKITEYDQGGRKFVPGLSVIDVLMWNGITGTRQMILDGRRS